VRTGDGSTAVVLVVDDETEIVLWRVNGPIRRDLSLVDALARLQLAARRQGWTIRVDNPCAHMSALLEFLGLRDALGCGGTRLAVDRVEEGREAEGGEELGVQEVVQPRDPPA